ncbi:hypothetical protein QEN19_002411 [Hanseniaspora menglaensis]
MFYKEFAKKKLICKRFVSYDKLFKSTIKSPHHYNISLDALRKENRALLLSNKDKAGKTEEINKVYKELKNDMSRYILYFNTFAANNANIQSISNLEVDPRVNKVNDFEFLEEIMDTMEQVDNLKNMDDLETIKENVSSECEKLKEGIDIDFKNNAFEKSLEKFQKLKYLDSVLRHVDARVNVLDDM